MISHLSIQGLALIEELSIDFSPGFNVLTGETGAGKSILIRALNFLIGAKASSESIRSGFDVATVEAHFVLPKKHAVWARLASIGVPCDSDLIVRRNLSSQGRSQAWINDHSVTLASLKSVGELLIDVFGQHENQRLLNRQCHLEYVDRFVKEPGVLLEYRKAYESVRGLVKSLALTLEQLSKMGSDQEYTAFRLEELDKFEPSLDDYEAQRALSDSGTTGLKAKEKLDRILSVLDGNGERSISERLWEVQKLLQSEKMEELQAEAAELASKAESLHFEISKRASQLDLDEDKIEEAQKRIFGYQNLFRKHHVREIEGLLSAYSMLQMSAASAEQLEEQLGNTLIQIEKKVGELVTLNVKQSKLRLEASLKMKKHIEAELKELSMPGARFGVEWNALPPRASDVAVSALPEKLQGRWTKVEEVLAGVNVSGDSACEFLLGANAGEALFPLSKVASGGELSRTMLALKKALSVDAETCVLVFDEIDTGISGKVADVVGKKLKELAQDFQVICISHLPQVAVYADTHFLVEKGSAKGKASRPSTRLTRLSSVESQNEIARLLSGETVTKTSLDNAKALIGRAQTQVKRKNNEKSAVSVPRP